MIFLLSDVDYGCLWWFHIGMCFDVWHFTGHWYCLVISCLKACPIQQSKILIETVNKIQLRKIRILVHIIINHVQSYLQHLEPPTLVSIFHQSTLPSKPQTFEDLTSHHPRYLINFSIGTSVTQPSGTKKVRTSGFTW